MRKKSALYIVWMFVLLLFLALSMLLLWFGITAFQQTAPILLPQQAAHFSFSLLLM